VICYQAEMQRLQRIADELEWCEMGDPEERAQHATTILAEMEPCRKRANAAALPVELEPRP